MITKVVIVALGVLADLCLVAKLVLDIYLWRLDHKRK